MYENIASMQHYQLHQEKIKYFNVLIGTIFLLTINMCDRGRTITHLQISRFHTQVWYKYQHRFKCQEMIQKGNIYIYVSYNKFSTQWVNNMTISRTSGSTEVVHVSVSLE